MQYHQINSNEFCLFYKLNYVKLLPRQHCKFYALMNSGSNLFATLCSDSIRFYLFYMQDFLNYHSALVADFMLNVK